jgi:hypothetical protein
VKAKEHASDRGFVKIRRGLREHLRRMPAESLKLYLWLHLSASWKGKHRGTVHTSYSDIADELDLSLSTIKRAMARLQPQYVKILQSGNQHQVSVIRILKYDTRQAGITDDTSRAGIKNDPHGDTSCDTSSTRKPNETLQTLAPKKVVEGSRSKDKAATAVLPPQKDSVWSFLGIQPCGPLSFRFLLESRWASRNGDRPSVVIGETVNAWEAAEGEKLRRAPQLFRTLSELRQREKQTAITPADSGKPIHVLTEEEIPA